MSESAKFLAGHNTFSKNQLVNDIVGTLVFAPLVYPFEPWRIKVKGSL
jgi:omega-6 fatty acid desaturase (delta-12 desaturase)